MLGEGGREVARGDGAISREWEMHDAHVGFCQRLSGLSDRGVFDFGGDEQGGLVGGWGTRQEDAAEGEVVRFRATGGEDEFAFFAVEEPSDGLAGEFNALAYSLPEAVNARRIRPVLFHRFHNGDNDPRVGLSGGVVVEISDGH